MIDKNKIQEISDKIGKFLAIKLILFSILFNER